VRAEPVMSVAVVGRHMPHGWRLFAQTKGPES
jgi:hypothetical protein